MISQGDRHRHLAGGRGRVRQQLRILSHQLEEFHCDRRDGRCEFVAWQSIVEIVSVWHRQLDVSLSADHHVSESLRLWSGSEFYLRLRHSLALPEAHARV